MLREALERDGLEVVAVASVPEALHRIATESYDLLLSDLHMPHAGDGFTVVSAMRHTHPNAATLVLSGYPALAEAMAAIRVQADEILVKPIEIASLSKLVRERLAHAGHLPNLLADLIYRLRLPANEKANVSVAARQHGDLRRRQGYTIPMVVEESRILQVSIFNTLQSNLPTVDFSKVLRDVITIANEVDSQLKQATLGYSEGGSASGWSAA
jgi:CheY-like chemotaxis protein